MPMFGGGGSGTVSSVATGTGLTGGPVISTGTISLASIANHDVLANTSGSSAAPIATTLSALIDDALGNTRGAILERGASGWAIITPGAANTVPVSGGAGTDPAYTTLTALIDAAIGSTRGGILERGASGWVIITPGASGTFLQSAGASADPVWASSGAGTVTSVGSGTGLTGGPITGSGSLSLASIANHNLLANTSGSSSTPTATTVTALIDDAIGSTVGNVLYRGASAWGKLSPLALAYGATVGTPAIGSLGTVHPDSNVTLSNSGTDYVAATIGSVSGAAAGLNGYTLAQTMTTGQRVAFLTTTDGIAQASNNYLGPAVGFTDGTKFHIWASNINASSGGLNSSLETWSSSTVRAGNTNGNKGWAFVPTYWIGIRYDGTSYYFEYSLNRIKWYPIITMTPNYLSSYTTLFFGMENFLGLQGGINYMSVDTAS